MENRIENQTFDQERALYHLTGGEVYQCTFAGPADGESVLKECRQVSVEKCAFSLRYPLWHARGFRLTDSTMDEKTRAPIWYAQDGSIEGCTISGTKCLRECKGIRVMQSRIVSPEFGWKCRDLHISDSEIESAYFLFESQNAEIDHLHLTGKYSFQYMENVTIRDSYLDTKDAFWHSSHVTVENSVVKGEYLGWFSDHLTLINCRIIGTQPLCYCDNLKLVRCTMEETDLSFEYSQVEADILGHVVSVKNPREGCIVADSIGEVVWEDPIMEVKGKVLLRSQVVPAMQVGCASPR